MSGLAGFLAKGDGDKFQHKTMSHAIVVCVLFHVSLLATGFTIDVLLTGPGGSEEEFHGYSTAAVVFLGYWFFLVGLRFLALSDGHVLAVYELMWTCSASLLFAAVAAALHRPALLCASAMLVAIDQVLWYVDIIGYLITGKLPLKVCAYLFWPSTPITKRITCLHHVLFAPLVVMLCVKGRGVPLCRGFVISAAQTVVSQLICRYTTPLEVPDKQEKNGLKYLNINLCYEAFRDVKVAWIKKYDRQRPEVYLPWMLWIWNFGNFSLFTVQVAIFLLPLWLTGAMPGARFIF